MLVNYPYQNIFLARKRLENTDIQKKTKKKKKYILNREFNFLISFHQSRYMYQFNYRS